jgi:hypothetical protein
MFDCLKHAFVDAAWSNAYARYLIRRDTEFYFYEWYRTTLISVEEEEEGEELDYQWKYDSYCLTWKFDFKLRSLSFYST